MQVSHYTHECECNRTWSCTRVFMLYVKIAFISNMLAKSAQQPVQGDWQRVVQPGTPAPSGVRRGAGAARSHRHPSGLPNVTQHVPT
eukprot:354318-Chlamydomonas_euryale.AAC.15